MEDEVVSIWNKTSSELTAGDSVKIAIAMTVITTAITIAAFTAAAGAANLAQRFTERKAAKLKLVTEEG